MTTQKKSLIGTLKTTKKANVATASASKGNSPAAKGVSSRGVKRVALGRYAG